MNQTFECTSIPTILHPQHSLQAQTDSVPSYAPSYVPSYAPRPQADITYPAYHNSQPPFPSQPFPASTDSARTHITMEMLFSSINIMNQRLERFDFEFTDRFSKLDKKLDERFGTIDRNLAGMRQEIDEIKETQKNHEDILKTEEKHHHEISDRMRMVENYTQDIEIDSNNLREDFLKLQSHSMKYNLIFGGIPQTDDDDHEDTEAVIKNFIEKELEIPSAELIQFQNVHRLRKRRDGKPRNIIARFTNFRDHERVRKSVPNKLKSKPQFSVNQQYPTEISNRRKALIPKLKDFQRRGTKASLIYDQIIVDGQPYNPSREEPPNPIHNARGNYS
ncbi:unnamed protein product [Mytilus coruscus]|uniref:Uncharacterized protein n=1 Tax=Mytilus coruscus TaxID=42192 RepID=A0A6J8BF37_MYTCO|nr:unnamed protein product [Mytilus coruscus]